MSGGSLALAGGLKKHLVGSTYIGEWLTTLLIWQDSISWEMWGRGGQCCMDLWVSWLGNKLSIRWYVTRAKYLHLTLMFAVGGIPQSPCTTTWCRKCYCAEYISAKDQMSCLSFEENILRETLVKKLQKLIACHWLPPESASGSIDNLTFDFNFNLSCVWPVIWIMFGI